MENQRETRFWAWATETTNIDDDDWESTAINLIPYEENVFVLAYK